MIIDENLELKRFNYEIRGTGGGSVSFQFDNDPTTSVVQWMPELDGEAHKLFAMREFKESFDLPDGRTALLLSLTVEAGKFRRVTTIYDIRKAS